jgi:hypothetical protein
METRANVPSFLGSGAPQGWGTAKHGPTDVLVRSHAESKMNQPRQYPFGKETDTPFDYVEH